MVRFYASLGPEAVERLTIRELLRWNDHAHRQHKADLKAMKRKPE